MAPNPVLIMIELASLPFKKVKNCNVLRFAGSFVMQVSPLVKT
jgi:hypothetical protein